MIASRGLSRSVEVCKKDVFGPPNAMRDPTMLRLSKILMTCFFLGALLLFSSSAMAEETVTVEIRTIYASSNGDECERSLRRLCGRLERGFAGFSAFRQLDRSTLQIARDQSGSLRLPTNSTVTVSYHGREEDFIKLGLTIEDRLNTTLRATPGSTFFQAGLRYQEGILILAITVE